MKPIIISIILITLSLLAFFGMKWLRVFFASDYDKMLDALYSHTVPLIKPEEIQHLEEYFILDTRSRNEYIVSSIKGAYWVNFPSPNLELMNTVDKNQKILVYCSVGYRSERVGEELLKMGFTNVYNLYGGIFEWTNNNKLLVDTNLIKQNKVHGYAPSWGKWIKQEGIEVVYE